MRFLHIGDKACSEPRYKVCFRIDANALVAWSVGWSVLKARCMICGLALANSIELYNMLDAPRLPVLGACLAEGLPVLSLLGGRVIVFRLPAHMGAL